MLLGCSLVSCSSHDWDIDDNYVFPTNNTNESPIVFRELKIGEITDIIYSARNFLIEDKKVDNKRYLRISPDLGITWKQFENPYGDIVYFHIFSTGDMMFATMKWCYFIDCDLTAITPSNVYDYDGNLLNTAALEQFFQIGSGKNHIWNVDGIEIHAWGDYNLEINDPAYIARMWYTVDYGRTIKCAIRFDQTKIDGKIINCRHIHGVRFDKYEKTFYVMTGDSPSNSQLIKGKIDMSNDTWEFHRLGTGAQYKFGSIYFDNEYAYMVTDYTTKETQSGIIKCKKNSLNDPSRFEYLYENNENRALLCCEFDMNGNKVLMPDGSVKSYIYFAKNNYCFTKIPISIKGYIEGFTSPNYAGDVYAGWGMSFPYTLYRCFNFTEAMRNSGVKDFMAIKEPQTEYFDEDFFFTQ